MFKFIHAADIHLDSPLAGLTAREDAPEAEIRGATRRALENLVGLCIEESVDFLIIAGDLYDGDWQDFSTGFFFNAQMRRLRDADILVYLISGNHDAESKLTKGLNPPENVHAFPTRKPASLDHPTLPVTLHGQGFSTPAVTDNLALAYPTATAGRFNIGLLHCSIGDSPHAPYAPCSVADLQQKSYDYWALGHIHQKAVLHSDPHIVYSGNIQGRHVRETGERGCYLVEVDDDLDITSHDFHTLDVVRWEMLQVDLTDLADESAALAATREALADLHAAAAPRLLCARIIFTGETALHNAISHDLAAWSAEVINIALDVSDDIWIEKVRVTTRSPISLDQLAGQSDLTDQVITALGAIDLATTPKPIGELLGKLPREAADVLAQDDAGLKDRVSQLVVSAITSSSSAT